jgi:hypothetical protein
MTIDEYLEQEKLAGGILAPNTNAAPRERPPTEDSEKQEEEERIEKIRWDKFTEENPKGIGNTMNRG